MKSELRSNKWVLCPKVRKQADMRLFCFPYAGGNAQMFRDWSKQFPNNIEVVAVNLPGRGSRMMEPTILRMEHLVHEIEEAIYPYLTEKPFAFFGHSMGALISFELTKYLLKERGICPEHIFVSAHRAPQLPRKDEEVENYKLSNSELMTTMKTLNGTPEWVLQNEELMELVLPIIRADMEVCETYEYVKGAPINVPITAFGGTQDEKISISEIEKWQEQTTCDFEMKIFQGDHFFIHHNEDTMISFICKKIGC